MLLQNNMAFSPNRKISFLSLLITIGLIIFIFEIYIPRPLPWLKPGFANIATLLALYLFDFKAAIIVVIGRVILGSLLVGTFLNPAFFLAFAGGIGSTIVMSIFKSYFSRFFSIFGVSIIGAITHNIIQLLLVSFIIIQHATILFLLPILILSALFTGLVVAFFSHYILKNLGI